MTGWIEAQPYYFNLTKAEEELKLSKYYPDIVNNPAKYVIEFHWIAEVPERERDALLFAEGAAKLGLQVTVVKTPWLKTVEEMTKLESTAHISNIMVAADFPEAGSLIEIRYHSNATGRWSQGEWLMNATFDAMIEDSLSTLDPTARFEKYANLQREVAEMCPSLYIFDSLTTQAQQDYVKIPAVVDPVGQATGILGYSRVYRFWQILPH